MPEFRFSLPAINSLYADQQLAYHPRGAMLVTGGPGSGKTVVTIFRFLRSVRDDRDLMLFTYHKTLILTIRGMLRARAEELFGELDEERINEIVENKLSTFFQWHQDNIGLFRPEATSEECARNFRGYIGSRRRNNIKLDELFFDEGQDLPRIVYNNVGELTTNVSVGADRAQNFKGYYPEDQAEDIILSGIRMHIDSRRQYLDGNHRNTRQIFELAKKFVPEDLRVQAMRSEGLREGNEPEIRPGLSEAQQLAEVKRIIENFPTSNIGILCHFGNEVETIKDYLIGEGYSCAENAKDEKAFSYYWHDMDRIDEAVLKKKFRTPFITTFESCKGLEFDIVIMLFFQLSNRALTARNSDGRTWATRGHYYVAVTRARSDIYILYSFKPASMNFYDEAEKTDKFKGLL